MTNNEIERAEASGSHGASSGVGRRGFLMGAAAVGAAALASAGAQPAEAAPRGATAASAASSRSGLDVRTLKPSDLSFTQVSSSIPYSIVSPNFRALDDRFRSRSLGSYEIVQLGENDGQVRVGRGLAISGSDSFGTVLRSRTAQDAAYSGVIVDVESQTGSVVRDDTVLVGLVRDARNYLLGWYNNVSHTAGIDVVVDGAAHTLGESKAALTAPFRLAFALTGPGASVLADDGNGWQLLTGADVSALLDLRGFGNSISNTAFDVAPKVPASGTLGQSFTVDQPFIGAGGMFPTYQTTDSSVTLSLYRDGPSGALITSMKLVDIPDDGWQFLSFEDPLPAGTYYLEQSHPVGTPAWWSSSTDVISWGQAYQNGTPVAGDRTIRVMFPAAEKVHSLLAEYRNSCGVRADAGTAVLGRIEAGYFGQAGVRDPDIVSLPNGAPYLEDGHLYLTLTNSGLAAGIPSAHMGVFRMSLRDYALEEVGKIFQSRQGLVLGDHAGRIIYDPHKRSFRAVAVTFGDFDVYGQTSIEYASTRANLTRGVHTLTSRTMMLGIDPYPELIDGVWRMATSDHGAVKFYRLDDDFATPVLTASNDNNGVYYEGTKLCKIGPDWYILASSSDDYRVYDLDTKLVGGLDAPHPAGYIPHPMVLPLALPAERTRFMHLSMDGDGDPTDGAFGHFLVNLSDQVVRGLEFPRQ